jgi:hypothetical protein
MSCTQVSKSVVAKALERRKRRFAGVRYLTSSQLGAPTNHDDICPNGFRPRCGRPRRAFATTKGQSGNLGRLHVPSADLLCRQSTARLRRPDADRDERRRCRVHRHPAVQPRDEGQGAGSAADLGGRVVRGVTSSPLAPWPGTLTLGVPPILLARADEVGRTAASSSCVGAAFRKCRAALSMSGCRIDRKWEAHG